MPRFASHLNDAGVTLLSDQGIAYREPGFALLEDDQLTTGNSAFLRARINPRRIQPGFAGIPNPLFAADNTLMFFGDGKEAVLQILGALEEAAAAA